MNRKEIAAYFGKTTMTISNWVAAGMPEHMDTRTGRLTYEPQECEEWLEERYRKRLEKRRQNQQRSKDIEEMRRG